MSLRTTTLVRRLAPCLVLTAVLTSLFGCVRRTDVGQSGNKVTVLSIAFWGSVNEARVMEIFLTEFEKQNPDIRVRRMHIPGSGYPAKLQTMMASNRSPDVFYLGMGQADQYMHNGVLVDLAPYLKKSKALKADDFFYETIRQFKLGNSIYALPKDWSPEVVFYNKDFFDAAGVPYPHDGWTWKEFVDASRKLTVRDARGNVQRYGTISYDWRQWVVGNGGKLFNDTRDKCIADSPEAIGGLQFAYDLSAKYGVAPQQGDPEVESSMYFMSGKTAMALSYRWYINLLSPLKRYHWAVGPVPHGKYPYNFSSVVGYAMSTQCTRRDAAWRLIEFLCGTEGQTLVTKNHWGVPTLKKLAARTDLFEEPEHPNYSYATFAREIKLSKMLLGSPYISYQRFEDIANREIDNMYLRQQTPPEAMRNIARKVNDVIAANRASGGGANEE